MVQGYSIFISVDGEKEDAVEKAKKEGFFEYELDYNHIRYVNEITKEEYETATK